VILVTTPADQLHELGAVLAATVAANAGWRVIYAGPALPAAEIAAAALRVQARAVALSVVHPADDPDLPAEFRRLRRLLPTAFPLLVGGRAASGYREVLTEIKATQLTCLNSLSAALAELRSHR
jgi:methylmalonyl-CoA mutase cobalamin-binding subunit